MDLPQAFLARMQTQLGDQYERFLETYSQASPTAIRLNLAKLSKHSAYHDLITQEIPWHPQAYFLRERPAFVEDPLFHAGAYYVQEAASMFLKQMLPELSASSRVLDLCAAPGGKSTLLASAIPEGALLVTNEVIQSRARILAENMTRWGYARSMVTHQDPSGFGKIEEFFDLILIDAPCSGEGMFRKDPQSRGEWSPEHVLLCASRQKRILSDMLPSLKPGGSVIYATCTFAPEENEANVQWLCEEYELEPDPVLGLEDFGASQIDILGVKGAAYHLMPHFMPVEGLFFARLKKAGEWEEQAPRRKKAKGKKGKQSEKSDPALEKEVKRYLSLPDKMKISSFQDKVLLMPEEAALFQQAKIHIIQAGLTVGKLHRKGMNPGHALALSQLVKGDLPAIELDLPQSHLFLKKEALSIPGLSQKGWVLMRYQGVNLGWAKIVEGKVKNHFPVQWRIRKQIEY